MDELTESMLPSAELATAVSSHPRPMPVREDCWSEDATFTLIEAWGQHYIELNRGNLRQKNWQEVADAVNARHGHIKKSRRTDVQCKNRIDTLKKKYKVEKGRVLETNGSYKSSWPFFSPLDKLIGSTPGVASASKKSSPLPSNQSNSNGGPPTAVPLSYRRTPQLPAAMALPMKRPSPATATPLIGESFFRKNYSAVAAAAAAAADTDDEEDRDEELDGSRSSEENGDIEGVRKLARAIERFGEVYARVEGEKQRQLVELEKQRMQFGKELECQRMQMLVEMQVQLEKLKRAKRSNSNVLQLDGVRMGMPSWEKLTSLNDETSEV